MEAAEFVVRCCTTDLKALSVEMTMDGDYICELQSQYTAVFLFWVGASAMLFVAGAVIAFAWRYMYSVRTRTTCRRSTHCMIDLFPHFARILESQSA